MDKTICKAGVSGRITPPSSKSYAQRAIAAALLSRGESRLCNIDLCQDTRAALSVIEALGATVRQIDKHTFAVTGGLDPRTEVIDIGESGLATRLFTPIASLCGRRIRVEGRGTMCYRPVSMMCDPLRELGVQVWDNGGVLPIMVEGPLRGGEIEVDGSISSQFITGLLMALPLAPQETQLKVREPRSIPYIDMTLDLVRSWGVEIGHCDYREFYIPGSQSYTPRCYRVEGDWSGAAIMMVAGAVAGEVTLRNLNPLSRQADTSVIEALSHAGAEIVIQGDEITVRRKQLRGFEFDATHCPDLFPALAALAANCKGITTLHGTRRLLHKESNRAEAIASEFGKMGIEVDIRTPDIMKIRGGAIRGADVESHGDHRMAMAEAVAALNASGPVTISGAECVAKSYPDFWRDLEKITVRQ